MADEKQKPASEKQKPASEKQKPAPVAGRQAMTAKEAKALGLDPTVYGG